jgi:hypothetical protein
MQKGFNMFSALVAAVLIMTSVVLVTTMTTTEDKMGNQLYYMLNTFQLNDAAAIARSDALQSFNYNFRSEMETYLTVTSDEMDGDPGNAILSTTNYNDWDGIVKKFEQVILLTDGSGSGDFNAVINFVADKTVAQFEEGSYGRYKVTLSSKEQDAKDNTRAALKEAIDCLATSGDDFLDVVDCSDTECDIGTFYFNIPLDCVLDETFESLPKIVVKDLITQGETKLPLLPKTRLKIYIPLRYFKAIHVARQNAKAIANVEGKLKTAKLGFCDGECTPREEPNRSIGGDWLDHTCPGNASDNEMQNIPSEPAGLRKYNAGGGTAGIYGLQAYAKQTICDEAKADRAWETHDLEFFNINGPDYALAYPGYGISGLEPDIGGLNLITDCPFKKIIGSFESAPSKIIEGTVDGKLYCGKLRLIESDVGFEERNPLYIVKGESIRYKIRILTEFFAEPITSTDQCTSGGSGGVGSTCRV